jgi:TRAP-type C4-dicarboxylate transport system permease small subunit
MRRFNKFLDGCLLALAGIAGVIVLLILLGVVYATLSRYLLNQPHAFLIDYAAYSLIYIAFLGTPWLYKNRGHVSIDMVATSLPDKARRILVGATDIVVLIIAIVMCVIGFQVTKSSYVSNIAVADFLNTPKWILLIPIPVSSFFLAIQAIRNAIAAFTSKTGMLGGAH